MRVSKCPIVIRHMFAVLLFAILLFACNSEQRELEDSLVMQAKSIILNNESSNPSLIETTISSIKDFLSEYPDSEHYSELYNYLDELNRCLDFHKVREYTEKYEELSSTIYYDINSAIQELDNYTDIFQSDYGSQILERQPKLQAFIEDAEQIKQEFETMESFFDREFSDLVSYNSEVQYHSYRYEGSRYETVRSSWKEIINSQRKEQASKDLAKKVANFEVYLKNDAQGICSYNHDDFIIDDSRSIQIITLGSPFQHDEYNAKVCDGVFRVYLKGAYLGWDKGSIKISVKGMITVIVDDNQIPIGVEYRNLDYTILEKTGDL